MDRRIARCVGCQWRVLKKMGGQGIICLQKDGTCPKRAIKWALRYTKNKWGMPRKLFATDEDLLEAMRL